MPELLPVPLNLPRPILNGSNAGNNGGNHTNNKDSDQFDTYGSLNDFRKMMSDLSVWLLHQIKPNRLITFLRDILIFPISKQTILMFAELPKTTCKLPISECFDINTQKNYKYISL